MSLGFAAGCFAEPAALLPDGATDDADGGTEATTSTTSTTTSTTADATNVGSTTDDATTTAGAEATTGATSTGAETDAGTTGSTTQPDGTTSDEIESACGVLRTRCAEADFFCESFEEFQWSPLPTGWNPVPGGADAIGPARVDAYCGDESLETAAVPGTHGVLGASIEGLDLGIAHRFGGAIRLDADCMAGADVRVMVFQYRNGGSQVHTVELWAEEDQISIRQDGIAPVVGATPLPLDEWVDVSVAVTPGRSIQATVGESMLSTKNVPAPAMFVDVDGQLLVGPLAPGGFQARCVQSFDDLFVRGTQ